VDLSIAGEAVEPASSRRRLRAVAVTLQEIAESLCCILILADSRE
jgi:hypothetical protein